MAPKNESLREVKTMTIAILMKLLATKIVARSRLGLLNNLITRSNDKSNTFSSFSSKDLICKEKKETSVPEISAEQIKRTITANHWTSNKFEDENKALIKGNGSESKGY